MKIQHVLARQIVDSRGEPTLEAEIKLEGGGWGRAAVPSGASTGEHEAHELRDGGDAFGGKGVSQAVAHVEEEISTVIMGIPADDQYLIDQKMIELDGSDNKSRLGANAILAVSLAVAHAAANARGIPLYKHLNDVAHNPAMSLPLPMMNFLNGGRHATQSSDFQEFMLIPTAAKNFADAMRIGMEVFQALKRLLTEQHANTAVGDEGGFTFPVSSNKEMLDLLDRATLAANYLPGDDIGYALDVAASEFLQDEKYHLRTEKRQLDAAGLINYLAELAQSYPILSIEDGLAQDDWDGWQTLTESIGHLQLVGDDLLVTNRTRLEKAIQLGAANAILIKPNQIGTLTETMQAVDMAKQHGWRTVISHRSGETEDVTIAHLAVGLGAGQIKSGSVSRGERTAKYNELLRIAASDSNLSIAQPFAR